MHDLTIISTLTGALAVALFLGWITQRLGLSTLVGYMLAGVIVGPFTPGFVADAQMAAQMAEIGVILLMFGVGMHFHPQELLRVWRIAVPGAVVQSAVAAVAGWGAARAFGWSHGAGIVLGMALAVASTVVLMRMLVEQNRLSSRDGHVAVGWLIVEDLFTVVALVVLPALVVEQGSAASTLWEIGVAVAKAGAFAALIWILGTRVVSAVMERMAKTQSTELFTITTFVIALGVAIVATSVFHVSVALGAFFAGLVVGQSRFGPQAAADMAPFRDVFSALFFVSVGMLFNPGFIFSHPLMVVVALAIVLIVKPLIALAFVMLMRDSLRTGLTVAVGLAQIGEFSFILGSLGLSLNVLPPEGMNVLVVAALASIAVNPLLFRAVKLIETRFGSKSSPPEETAVVERAAGTVEADYPVVITGQGEAARKLAVRCMKGGMPVCVVDGELESFESLRENGIPAVFGDAGRPEVLNAAGIARARVIVVTNPALADKMRICTLARQLNPRIVIVARSAGDAERTWLQEFGVAHICDAIDETTEALMRAIRGVL